MATACLVAYPPLRVRVRVPRSDASRPRPASRVRADLRERRGVRRARRSRAGDRGGRARCRDDRRRRRDRGWRGPVSGRTRADAGAEASTSDSGSAPRWALGAFAASAVALGVALAPSMDARFPRLHVGPVVIQQEGWRGAGRRCSRLGTRPEPRAATSARSARRWRGTYSRATRDNWRGELPGALLERRGVHRRTGLDADQGAWRRWGRTSRTSSSSPGSTSR